MRKILWIVVILAGLLSSRAEELIENGSFAEGKSKWDIKGDAKEGAPGDSAVTILLDDHHWTLVEQDLRLSKTPPSSLAIKIELMASADFKPAAESKEYSDVDFKMGGGYGWSARVFPKCDFLIQVDNGGGWDYRPVQLQTNGSWQSITATVEKIKAKKTVLTLAFPPGKGSVKIKTVSARMP